MDMNNNKDSETLKPEQEAEAAGNEPVVITRRDLELPLDRDTLTIDERRLKRRKN